jgi:hypothetical protein
MCVIVRRAALNMLLVIVFIIIVGFSEGIDGCSNDFLLNFKKLKS